MEQNETGTRAGISDEAAPEGEGLEQETGRKGTSYYWPREENHATWRPS